MPSDKDLKRSSCRTSKGGQVMATGIVFLVIGVIIILFTLELYYYRRITRKKRSDELVGGLITVFDIGALLMYIGGSKIDEFKITQSKINIEQHK